MERMVLKREERHTNRCTEGPKFSVIFFDPKIRGEAAVEVEEEEDTDAEEKVFRAFGATTSLGLLCFDRSANPLAGLDLILTPENDTLVFDSTAAVADADILPPRAPLPAPLVEPPRGLRLCSGGDLGVRDENGS